METLMSGNENILALMYAMTEGLTFDELNRRLKDDFEKIREGVLSSTTIKPSVFNYYVKKPEKILVYNTLYNAMAKLTAEEFSQLSGEKICDDELRKNFLESGLCVTAATDERENYRKWREEFKQRQEYLSINITTTLKCNARCPYCYEHGVKFVDFDETKIDALINFIVEHKKSPPVKLNWFGGEPFMNPALIDTITKNLDERGIRYSSFAITNGSLITRQMIKSKFKRWNLRGVQITLDGLAEQYERRKNYVGVQRNPFKKIINRIKWLSEGGINVDIRLNIDRENMKEILNLIYFLQARFDGDEKVVYYPAFVTGVKDKLTDAEKISFVKELFIALANPNKFSVNRRLYSFPRNIACMRNDPQSYSVDAYGRIYNCEHLVGRKEKSLGTLKRLSKEINEARAIEPLRAECEECIFLPKCMGGCASNLNTNDAACMIERYMIQAYAEYMVE